MDTSFEGSTDSYALLQTLTPGCTFLCSDVSSNILVLKRLDEDCLHQRRLHPSIRERLVHIRDLPHGRLAILRGVERWDGQACMVWSWLDGDAWDEALEKPIENFGSLASSLVEAVDTLHEMGIVHGSLHAKNIIVRRDGQAWLTDVSPYLYTDPTVDNDAVVELLELARQRIPIETATRLGGLLEQFRAGSLDLRQLSRALRNVGDPGPVVTVMDPGKTTGYRMSSILSAIVVAAIGVSIWLGIRHLTANPAGAAAFPSLKLPAQANQ